MAQVLPNWGESIGQGIKQGFEGFMDAMARARKQRLEDTALARQYEQLQRGNKLQELQLLGQTGMDPNRLIAGMEQSRTAVPGAQATPEMDMFSQYMEQSKQGLATGRRASEAGARKTEAEASFYEAMASGGGPKEVNINGERYLAVPGRSGIEYKKIEKPAQSEFSARGFADKAKQAEGVLSGLTSGGFDPGSFSAGFQAKMPNIAQSGKVQSSEQALKQFVNAILRRESGAAVPEQELARYRQQYWPSMGDSPEVQAQKAEARRLAVANLEREGARVPSDVAPQAAKPVATGLPGKVTLDQIQAEKARRKGGRPQ